MMFALGMAVLLAAGPLSRVRALDDPTTCWTAANVMAASSTGCLYSPATCPSCTSKCVSDPTALRAAVMKGEMLLRMAEEQLQVCQDAGDTVSGTIALMDGKTDGLYITCPSSGDISKAYSKENKPIDVDEDTSLAVKSPAWTLDEDEYKTYITTNCSDHTLTDAEVKAYAALSPQLNLSIDAEDAGKPVCSARLLGPESVVKLAAAVTLCETALTADENATAECTSVAIRAPSDECWKGLLPHFGRTEEEIDAFMVKLTAADTACGAATDKALCDGVDTSLQASLTAATDTSTLMPASSAVSVTGFAATMLACVMALVSF